MRGKSLTARALSRYYLDRGLTSYTWLSDQFSTYGTQVIVSTDRARQAAAHRARRPLVRRGSLPAADRPPAQPGRVRQRPTPSPLGRPTRQRSPPPPRRPDHAGALSHPADQCLHPVDDPVPAGRGRRPPRRRHRRPSPPISSPTSARPASNTSHPGAPTTSTSPGSADAPAAGHSGHSNATNRH